MSKTRSSKDAEHLGILVRKHRMMRRQIQEKQAELDAIMLNTPAIALLQRELRRLGYEEHLTYIKIAGLEAKLAARLTESA